MLLGTIMMFLNVWGVIWRNQKVVLANAANVLAGGEADPDAAGSRSQGADGLTAELDLLGRHAVLHGLRRPRRLPVAVDLSSGKIGAFWIDLPDRHRRARSSTPSA